MAAAPAELRGDDDYGMKQLKSPAWSVLKLARWLQEAANQQGLPKPLGSIRLLIAPSTEEWAKIREVDASLVGSADHCCFENVKNALWDWRADCARNSENVAWFYFAGHGVQASDPSLMLLSHYNQRRSALLDEALSLQNVMDGMRVTGNFRDMAHTQHFVVDACRMWLDPKTALTSGAARKVWNSEEGRSEVDLREVATLLGSLGIPGSDTSYGNEDGTLLSQALLQCLKGGAAQLIDDREFNSNWQVKNYRLIEIVSQLVLELSKRLQTRQMQRPSPGNLNNNVLWSIIRQTPNASIVLENPQPNYPPQKIALRPDGSLGGETIIDTVSHPYTAEIPCGRYELDVQFALDQPYADFHTRVLVEPPVVPKRLPLLRKQTAVSLSPSEPLSLIDASVSHDR